MKKPATIFCVLLMSSAVFFAQKSEIDSLILMSSQMPDREKAGAYYELSRKMLVNDTDSALYFANQAELILQKDDPGLLLPFIYKSKGSIYRYKLMGERSLFYYRKAYDEFIKLENQKEIGECALRIGNLYYDMANFAEAYFFYMQSLDAYEKEGNLLGIANMENNLGMVSHDMNRLDDAEVHYRNAFAIYHENGYFTDECGALSNIGGVMYDRQMYDSALYYFQAVIDRLPSDSLDSPKQHYILSGVYNNTALAYMELRQYKEALAYLRLGLKLADQAEDPYNVGSVYINLGALYGEMGQQDSALYYLHRALQTARNRGFRYLELDAYEELAKLHAGIGSYASAYNWQIRYDTLYKSVFNEVQSDQIARLRTRYEQEISEKEIQSLQSESQVQKMLNKVFISFILVIVTLVIIIAVNLRSKKRTNQVLAERNLQISSAIQKLSESENELQKLNQSKDRIFSVVAHDLRNPVAAVNGFSELLYDNFDEFPVETQKEYLLQILQGTQRIQSLLENLLIWARSQMKAVKYKPESLPMKTLVEDCLREMKANLDHKKVESHVEIDQKCVVFADKAMIHTVIRNLIANAIKFSFPGGKIRITSALDMEKCQMTISDNGIGIQPEIQEKLFHTREVISTPGTAGEAGSGLGLVICKEFLERNHGSIHVESEPGNGSSFIISLPRTDGPLVT